MGYRIVVFLILSLLFMNNLGYGEEIVSKESVFYYNEGVEMQRKGSYFEASSSYNKALLLRPNSSYTKFIQNNFGVMYGLLGQLEAAEGSFKQAMSGDLNYLSPQLNLGLVYDREGDQAKAIEYWLRIFNINLNRLKPEEFVISGGLENNDKETLLADSKDPLSQKILLNTGGIILTQKGDLNKAEEKFKAALKIDPDYRAAKLNLGLVYDKKQIKLKAPRQNAALKAIEYWLNLFNIDLDKLKPKDFTVLDGTELKNKDILMLTPKDPATEKFFLNSAAIVLAQNQELEAAEEKFTAALKIDPAYRPAQLNLGLIYDLQPNRLKSLLFWLKVFDIRLEDLKPKDFIVEGPIKGR